MEEVTGKSLSEALLFAEHGENMLCTKIVLNVRNNFCTQHVLPRFELGIFMYWTCQILENDVAYEWVHVWEEKFRSVLAVLFWVGNWSIFIRPMNSFPPNPTSVHQLASKREDWKGGDSISCYSSNSTTLIWALSSQQHWAHYSILQMLFSDSFSSQSRSLLVLA